MKRIVRWWVGLGVVVSLLEGGEVRGEGKPREAKPSRPSERRKEVEGAKEKEGALNFRRLEVEERKEELRRWKKGGQKGERFRDVLEEGLSDPDSGVVREALEVLEGRGEGGDEWKAKVGALLLHPEGDLRGRARRWLQAKAGLKARPRVWHRSLGEATQEAQGIEPIVLVIHADWCGPCNQLSNEVLDTPDGQGILREVVGGRVDFETPQGQALTKRYGVFGLPTTFLLQPDGREVARLEGYGGRAEYLRSFWGSFGLRVDLGRLEREAKARPKDRDLHLRLAKALLVAGREAEGLAILKEQTQGGGRIGSRAFTLWGRWYLRVQKKPKEGTKVFLDAMDIYRGTPAYGGFLFWAAKGYHEQGQTGQALGLFEAWEKDPKARRRALLVKADFLEQIEGDPQLSHKAILAAKQAVPRSSWLSYVLAKNAIRRKQPLEAWAAIDEALCLSPRMAIFVNLRKQLPPQASYQPKPCASR